MRPTLLAFVLVVLAAGGAAAGKDGKGMSRKVQVGDVIRSAEFGRIQTGWTRARRGVSTPTSTPHFGQAKFVVEEAKMAHGGHDTLGAYPAGWSVLARELHADGRYDPNGATVEFMQSENHNGNVPPSQITLVKQMVRTFVDR